MSSRSVSGELLDSSVKLGHFMTGIQLAIALVIGLAMIGIAVIIMMRKRKYTQKATGVVDSPKAAPDCNKGVCENLAVKYGGSTLVFDQFVSPNGRNYVDGDAVSFYVNPKDTTDFSQMQSPNFVAIGAIILVLALIAIGVAIFIFWIARKNTAAAAIAGPLSMFRLL